MDLGEVRLIDPSPVLAANGDDTDVSHRLDGARRDVVALGIAIAAIIMFVGNGGTVVSQAIRSWMGVDRPPDVMLVNALRIVYPRLPLSVRTLPREFYSRNIRRKVERAKGRASRLSVRSSA